MNVPRILKWRECLEEAVQCFSPRSSMQTLLPVILTQLTENSVRASLTKTKKQQPCNKVLFFCLFSLYKEEAEMGVKCFEQNLLFIRIRIKRKKQSKSQCSLA